MGESLFSSFSQSKRKHIYTRMLLDGWMKLSQREFPELDVLLIEWRWPIPGRNTPEDRGTPNYQNDLDRQIEVLNYYSNKNIPLVVWDLDHKLSFKDETDLELLWDRWNVFETAVEPRFFVKKRMRVEPPFVISDLLQKEIVTSKPKYRLGYIGSRYERDECIDRWIKPILDRMIISGTKFWGKWEPRDELVQRWKHVQFGNRIGVAGFYEAYSQCAAVPLLAKQSYFDCGFVTPRIWEAVLFGSLPLGLKGHLGIEQYVLDVAQGPDDLLRLATEYRSMAPIRRQHAREMIADKLSFMDVKNFVDNLEKAAG